MAKSKLDGAKITLPCPQCGKKTRKSVGWLRDHPTFSCSGCSAVFDTKQFARDIERANKIIADFIRKLGK